MKCLGSGTRSVKNATGENTPKIFKEDNQKALHVEVVMDTQETAEIKQVESNEQDDGETIMAFALIGFIISVFLLIRFMF